jgi:hypothetical protein
MVAAPVDTARRAGSQRLRLRAPAGAHAFREACGFARAAEAAATHALRLMAPPPPASR